MKYFYQTRVVTVSSLLEVQMKVIEDFTITGKAPTWALSWLKASTIALSHLGHYAKRVPSP